MDFISEEQRAIVLDKSRIKLVNGAAGAHKTSTLIKCGIHYLSQGKNVIFLTKISSVTDEITKRMTRGYQINFEKSASHFVGTYQNSYCSVANFDSFIDKQLRKVGVPFEGEAFNQKVKQLTRHMEQLDSIVMKNDKPIDVVLIDEVQDFDKIRVEFTAKLFNHIQRLNGVFVGDTLQTVFIQSIIGEGYSMNYLKSNLAVKYFELSTCFRCPKGQIDFVNQVMGPYQQRYGISPIKSNNQNLVDKPVLFQHHSVHKEYQRTDLCDRVIHIIQYVLDNDTSVTPDDIVVVMNKTNSNAVFEKLLVALNTYYKQRYDCDNYQHVIHYKTKNHEGRKTIDWSVGEEKTKFISIHGIKGKGQRVVILLGMSEKSIPMVEWLFKTEELVSQSVMNVALTRSEKYLFIGINSIPSRYIQEQMDTIENKGLAYCSWNPDTYDTESTPEFYKNLMTSFEKFDIIPFVKDKYTREIVYTPSKSVLAIKEDIVQEFHISDCISNAFQLMTPEILTKSKFGKRMFIPGYMNIVERGILGVMCELLVQRYMRVYTGNMIYDNEFLRNYIQESRYHFTNHQGLLNLVFDLKLNRLITQTERWYKTFEEIKNKTKHIKSLKEQLSLIKQPTYILDTAFEKIGIRHLLQEYFTSIPNDQVDTRIYWNLALFQSALSGHYKMVSVMMYINAFNRNISSLHGNVKYYCHNHLISLMSTHNIAFQKEINVLKRVSDEATLSQLNPELLKGESKRERTYTYGIMGVSDVVIEKRDDVNHTAILHELKCISCSDTAKLKTWVFQAVLYGYLLKKLDKRNNNNIETICIVNLLSGVMWKFDMTRTRIKYRDTMEYIFKEKQFPEVLIEKFLDGTRD